MGECESRNNFQKSRGGHRFPTHNNNNNNNYNNNNSIDNNDQNFNDLRKNSYFPENFNDKGNLILNNDVIVMNSNKNPFQVYQVLKLLGEGSFGEVWKVRHKKLGKEFAMKIITKSPYFKEKSIFNEINILKKLDHPNILKILDFYYSTDKFFVITEYCTGGELFQEIKVRNIFTEDQAAFVLYQILSAIRYCHKMRVIHEDIKPENIMITRRDKNYLYIKLIDFGTAKIFKEGNMQKGMVGSAYYIAPEVIGGAYNESCDIWSIGVIMYLMLIGSPPFDGNDDESIFKSIKKGIYSTSSYNYKNLSNDAKDLISKLLEYDPNKRITAKNALNHPWFKSTGITEIMNKRNKLDINEIQYMLNNLQNYRNYNIIKSAAFAYLVHQNTEIIQCQNAIKLFHKIDLNKDGKIDQNELEQALMKYYNINSTEARKKVIKIFENIDTDNNNFIESEEFIRGCIDPRIFNSENFLRHAFDYFDEERNGYISIDQIQKKFLQSSKNKSTVAKKELKTLFKSIDENQDGFISFQEFSWMMRNIINSD